MAFADNELLHMARKSRAFWNAFLQFWEHLGSRAYGDSTAPLNTCVDLSSQVTADLIIRAIESPSVVRMTGDQAAAYVKLLHTADPSSMKIKDLSREQLEEAFALLSDLVHGGEFAAAMNSPRYCPNLPMAAWKEFFAAEEFVKIALGVARP